jgi:hypothetical protein
MLFRRFENFSRKPSEIPIRDPNLGALVELMVKNGRRVIETLSLENFILYYHLSLF